MAKMTPLVRGDRLIYQQDDHELVLAVETPAWFAWLATASTFAFTSDNGTFTARSHLLQRKRWNGTSRPRDRVIHCLLPSSTCRNRPCNSCTVPTSSNDSSRRWNARSRSSQPLPALARRPSSLPGSSTLLFKLLGFLWSMMMMTSPASGPMCSLLSRASILAVGHPPWRSFRHPLSRLFHP